MQHTPNMYFVFYCLLWPLFCLNIGNENCFIFAQENFQIFSDKLKQKTDDRCEIEILTHGSCLINEKRIEPKLIINFKGKPKNENLTGLPFILSII